MTLVPSGTFIQATQSSLRGGDEVESTTAETTFDHDFEDAIVIDERDRNLADSCSEYTSSHQTDSAFGNAEATKDCPSNMRMVAYKCSNYNDDYFFAAKSELRYKKIDGREFLKGITCNFDPETPWSGGSKTEAKVWCVGMYNYVGLKNVSAKKSGKVKYQGTVRQYVDCGAGYHVASFTCSTSNSKFKLCESSGDKLWGTKSKDEPNPGDWEDGWNRHVYDAQHREYDRYAYCVYENKSWGAWIAKQSTTVTVTAKCESRTCDL